MTSSPELLDAARRAGARLDAAERDALLARADYHTAIRRLHLAGAPLREIAQALSISHQRVQQIVRGAGGSWWSRVWRTRNAGPDASCTWCGRPPSEVARLIAGPGVFVCDSCVSAAEETMAGGRAVAPFEGTRKRGVGTRCSFCGKSPAEDRVVATSPRGRVCAGCLATCRQILDAGGA